MYANAAHRLESECRPWCCKLKIGQQKIKGMPLMELCDADDWRETSSGMFELHLVDNDQRCDGDRTMDVRV